MVCGEIVGSREYLFREVVIAWPLDLFALLGGGGRWPKHGGKAPEMFHAPPEAEAEKEGDSAGPEEAAQDPALRFRAQNLGFLSGKSFVCLFCVVVGCVVVVLRRFI